MCENPQGQWNQSDKKTTKIWATQRSEKVGVSENEHCWVMGMLLIQGQPFNINFKQQANFKNRLS
jgi:hypothetical protein